MVARGRQSAKFVNESEHEFNTDMFFSMGSRLTRNPTPARRRWQKPIFVDHGSHRFFVEKEINGATKKVRKTAFRRKRL